MSIDVVVPDLGDFDEVEVIEVFVKAGDTVAAEDPLITLETEKAAMDVPSTASGKIKELKVGVGDTVSAGALILVLEGDEESDDSSDDAGDDSGNDADDDEETPSGASDASNDPNSASADDAREPHAVTVPDLGDFSDVEVIEVLVEAGEDIEVEQGLITLETEKATMDVPSTVAGTVTELKVKVGDTVNPGDEIAVIEPKAGGASSKVAKPEPPKGAKAAKDPESPRPEKPAPGSTSKAKPAQPSVGRIDEATFSQAHASPSVRKLARELGVDLGRVEGSGRKGRVTAEDVKAFVKAIMQGSAAPGRPALPQVPEIDFAKFGDVEIKPLTRIQKISGPRLHASWVNVPHVTQHDEADITDLEAMRKSLKDKAAERGIKLTPLAFVIRACVLTLAEFPVFKSSLASDGENLVLKQYTHVGFAADTPNGLVVPVIRDADKKDIYELAASLGDLSSRARDGKLKAQDMHTGG
jgi:pyruvate dehydrogenase E2 component (dihydrolipoamide acetyltransferase)